MPNNQQAQPDRPDGAAAESVRIRTRKVKYTTAWLYFGLFLCLFIAWWFPVRMLFRHILYPPVKSESPRDSSVFLALAYEGVSGKSNEVSPDLFREHLNALVRNGYVPLSLRDVRDFYQERKLLPRKGVLLTFDHGRKTSYFACNPEISKAGWKAVMFLWTRPIENDQDNAVLRWPYLRNMVRSGIWEVGAQSHNGFERIDATAGRRRGNFMTSVKWLEGEKRFETLDQFQQRLADDHARCLEIIKRNLGVEPIAYAYPYGDFGQFQSRALVARYINTWLVRKLYPLGFSSGNFAANTRYTDPQRLRRLQVRPDWTGAELVARLDRAWPEPDPVIMGEEARRSSAWILDWGKMTAAPDGLTLSAATNATGAKMWLAGSDLSQNASVKVSFRLRQGQLGIYLRASPDEESFVYLGIDARGDVWLREKEKGRDKEPAPDTSPVFDGDFEDGETVGIWLRQRFTGQARFTLASDKVWLEPGKDHTLDLVTRGKLLVAMLNGRQLFSMKMTSLQGVPRPGMLGISMWDPQPGKASVTIRDVALRNLPSNMATWPISRGSELHTVQWIHDNVPHLSALSPPWQRISPLGDIRGAASSMRLFSLLARTYDFKFIPELEVQAESGLDKALPAELVEKAAAGKFDGVFVNLAALSRASVSAVSQWLLQCRDALKEKGLSLYVQLPGALETAPAAQSILAVVPGLHLVSNAGAGLATNEAVIKSAEVLEKAVVPEQKIGEDDPFYFELDALSELGEAPGRETRLLQLQHEGEEEFVAGHYTKALATWQKWREMEPNNPRVLMLIGDACLRLGDKAAAAGFYDQSLAINPAQIGLLIRRSQMLYAEGRRDEAREMLNNYARLFPDNPDIVLAQADWLHKENRRKDARALIDHVLSVNPDDVNARVLLHSLLEQPRDRYQNMRRLLDAGRQPALRFAVGTALLRHSLLALPESCLLLDFVERMAAGSTNNYFWQQPFLKLNPLTAPLVETFGDKPLSPAWQARGGGYTLGRGWIRLKTDEGHSEMNLQIFGTETLQSGYIEADLNDVFGTFWLSAHRMPGQMVRFGYDMPTETVHMQVWQGGHRVFNKNKPWQKPPRPVRFRMEVRGDGASGYVDGAPFFNEPIQIPFEMAGGPWAVGVYDQVNGAAQATLLRLAAGPMPVHIACLPQEIKNEKPEDFLRKLIGMPYNFTVMAPRWFRQSPDGSFARRSGADADMVRIFALYYRIRLLPMVEMRTPDISGAMLAKAAKDNNVQGFVLLFPEMPPQEWFDRVALDLEDTPLDIVAVVTDRVNHMALVRNVRLGYGAIPEYSVFPEIDGARIFRFEQLGDEDSEKADPGEDSMLWM